MHCMLMPRPFLQSKQQCPGLGELSHTCGSLQSFQTYHYYSFNLCSQSDKMTTQISKKRKVGRCECPQACRRRGGPHPLKCRPSLCSQFVADGVFYAELNELLTRELAEDGYSGVEVRVTPMRTEIIIRATRTQSVLGEEPGWQP